jgi:hypothetical protein
MRSARISIPGAPGSRGALVLAPLLCLLPTACPASRSASDGAPAVASIAPPAVCAQQETITVAPAAGDQAELALSPDPFDMGRPRQGWRGDINDDTLPDLVVIFPDACGNWGECPHGVLAGCGGNRYAVVWAPEHAVDLSAGAHRARVGDAGWRDLIELRRAGTPEKPDAETRTLRFDGTRYQPLASP